MLRIPIATSTSLVHQPCSSQSSSLPSVAIFTMCLRVNTTRMWHRRRHRLGLCWGEGPPCACSQSPRSFVLSHHCTNLGGTRSLGRFCVAWSEPWTAWKRIKSPYGIHNCRREREPVRKWNLLESQNQEFIRYGNLLKDVHLFGPLRRYELQSLSSLLRNGTS